MKKVKYVGDLDVMIPTLGLDVKKGDVIDVPDDFFNALFNALFEDVAEKKSKEVVTNG